MNSFQKGRAEKLAMHPTVKPVALVADAILDCSKRGGLVLDCFAGSGTTLIAAERTGRVAAGMELDPHYADVILRRFCDVTGIEPVNASTGVIVPGARGGRPPVAENYSVGYGKPPRQHSSRRVIKLLATSRCALSAQRAVLDARE